MSSPIDISGDEGTPPKSDTNLHTPSDNFEDEKLIQLEDPIFKFAPPVFLVPPTTLLLPENSSDKSSVVSSGKIPGTPQLPEMVEEAVKIDVKSLQLIIKQKDEVAKKHGQETLLVKIQNAFLQHENVMLKKFIKGGVSASPWNYSSDPFQLHKVDQYPSIKLTHSERQMVIDYYDSNPMEKFVYSAPTEEEQKALLNLGNKFWVDKDSFTKIFNAPGESCAQKARALLFSVIKKEAIIFCSVDGMKKGQSQHKYTKLESDLLQCILEMTPQNDDLEDVKVAENFKVMIRKSISNIRQLSFPTFENNV